MTTDTKTPAAATLAAAANTATAAVTNKLTESEALALAQVHREAIAESKAAEDLKEGDNVLLAGSIAAQVNALTGQVIPHGNPVIAKFDRWIEIQLGAGVLTRHKL